MTIEEYKISKTEIEKNYEMQKKQLLIDFARSNQKYQIGDKISDGNKTLIISKAIPAMFSTEIPATINYSGIWLKKDGTPNKRNETDSIYEPHVK